ncbi:MAG: diacylglycerol kinase family protein [Ferruginibacter sp.]
MKQFLKSFAFAFSGIAYCFKRERNFYIHILASILALGLSFFLSLSSIEFVIVILCIAAVLTIEMINTAIEQLCNFISRERNPAIGIIKDISAGAVLVMSLASLACGLIIFLPKLLTLLK